MNPDRGAKYHKLPKYDESRQDSLRRIFAPYIEATDDYGKLICGVVDILGSVPSTSVQDRVIRDLLSDVFDVLYESRRIIMSGQCATAYPLLRRAYESLSLMVVCTFDSVIADKWQSGAQIQNSVIRAKLAAHPMGEAANSTREAYKFFSEVAHPNRSIIPNRHLGDGNEFVLASIMIPDACMVTEYCLHHLGLWFWFTAAVSHHYVELLHQHDAAYHDDYQTASQAARCIATALESEFNRLLATDRSVRQGPAS